MPAYEPRLGALACDQMLQWIVSVVKAERFDSAKSQPLQWLTFTGLNRCGRGVCSLCRGMRLQGLEPLSETGFSTCRSRELSP